jgi:hypothetical protein
VYRAFTDDPVLFELEAEARAAERGIWGLPESQRVPPWEWRRQSSSRRKDPASTGTKEAAPKGEGAAADFRCGAKSYCREMAGCAEARFYLERCGLTCLDGDGDGVPCESLCRGR